MGIKAVNAFWDNERKGYVTKHFGIIDDYELFDSKQREARGQGHLAISYVRLSEVLFESIQAGYIKTIDITTYYKLESAIAKRLYRYLDKKKYDGKNYFTINLFTLTELHLGLKGTKYPSQIKQQIDPAHEELRKAGFLASWKYEKTTEGKSEKVTYTFAEKKKALPVPAAQKSGDSDPLLEKLLQIGISNGAAERLMRKYPREEIEAQIKALPYRNAENPAALLHQAIKEKWPLPETLLKEEHRMERRSAEQARQEAEARVREERRQKIESYILALTPAELAELHQEAEAKARQECPGVYKDRDVPEHIIRGYVSEMAGERIKK